MWCGPQVKWAVMLGPLRMWTLPTTPATPSSPTSLVSLTTWGPLLEARAPAHFRVGATVHRILIKHSYGITGTTTLPFITAGAAAAAAQIRLLRQARHCHPDTTCMRHRVCAGTHTRANRHGLRHSRQQRRRGGWQGDPRTRPFPLPMSVATRLLHAMRSP